MMRWFDSVTGRSCMTVGGCSTLTGLVLVLAACASDPSERAGAFWVGSAGLVALVGGLVVLSAGWERRRGQKAASVLHPTLGVAAPSMPELFAAVADRALRRVGAALVLWGIASMVIAAHSIGTNPLNWVPLTLGTAMTVAGAVLLCRAVAGAFVAAGAFLVLVGAWNLGASFLIWAQGAPVTNDLAFWSVLGACQLWAARIAFLRAHAWNVVLEKIRTVPSPDARLYLKWLLAAPAKTPYVVSLCERLTFSGLVFRRARAYVASRTVLVVADRGFECFALSCEAMSRAMAGEIVWDSAGVERSLRLRPEQAEKMRALMSASTSWCGESQTA
jgi:hypothetical protein